MIDFSAVSIVLYTHSFQITAKTLEQIKLKWDLEKVIKSYSTSYETLNLQEFIVEVTVGNLS